MSGARSRRTLLVQGARLTAGAAAGGALATLLAACDADERGPQAEQVLRTSIAVDLASYYAPLPDLKRLTLARAKAAGVQVLFSADPAGSRAQVDSVTRVTGEHGGFRVIAVAPFDPAAIEPIAEAAIGRGLQIVSFLTPLEHQTGGIVVDTAAMARALVEDAARGRGKGVLVVAPPRTVDVPDPFLPVAVRNGAALTAALGASSLGAPVATVEALAAADTESGLTNALRAYPEIEVVLTSSDATALGAIAALEAVRGRRAARRAYVGALGAPSITTAATLDALDDGGPLRAVVAPQLRALAEALVDVPNALLKGGRGQVVTVPFERFTAGAEATRAARSDVT